MENVEQTIGAYCVKCSNKIHAKGLCRKHYSSDHYQRNRTHPPRQVMSPEERKAAQARACAKWLSENRHKSRQTSKKWREKHPEYKEVRAQNQLEYAAKNREQERQRAAKWRADNPEKYLSGRRAYYLKNSDSVRAAVKERRRKNLAKYQEYSRDYKARKRAGGGRLSRGYIAKIFLEQSGLCLVCRHDLKITGHHIDHIIPIAKGGRHCDENVQLLCPSCNCRKSTRNFQDFINLMEAERGER